VKIPSIGLALLLSLGACAPVPRPTIMTELEGVSTGAAAADARTFAPDAFARAQKLRGEADAAFAAGDNAGAQMLAERALAAYAHAHALARMARAAAQLAEAKAALTTSEGELAALDAEQTRAAADADALELKLKVTRDALPVTPSGKADPEREKARLAAARALAAQARLLCGAARLLGGGPALGAPPPPAPDAKILASLDEAEGVLGKVEADLAGPAILAAPIDGATRARAACLTALTATRRAAAPVSRAPGVGDALLAEISATGKLDPARDDRGVAVTLRGVFGGSSLTPAGEARLAELGKIAAAHPSFPVELVLHTDKPVSEKEEPAQKVRAELATRALLRGAGNAVRVLPLVAGNRAPVADPAGPDRARNARLEVVFVTPEGF
jgi:outer membrane protein OmpA-like peptidoglycan-associated protein